MNQEKIGKYIYELRIKNNLTQKDLADKLSITSQAVSKWENGRGIPDIEQLNKLSEIFNVDIKEIINGEDNKKTYSGKIKYTYNSSYYKYTYRNPCFSPTTTYLTFSINNYQTDNY